MGTIEQDLAACRLFRKLDLTALRGTASHWSARTLSEGEVLWRDGTHADELAVVVAGELAVETWSQEVGRIPAGQLAGEGTAFTPGEPRTATVRAATDARLLLLGSASLLALREESPPVYDFLLDCALRSMAERVGETALRIARLSAGAEEAPSRKAASGGAFKSIWKRAKAIAGGGAPPVDQALLFLPGLDQVDARHVSAIGEAMRPKHVPEGRALFLEGDVGDAVYLVAEGVVDVLRNTGRGRAEQLASLHMGSLFGTGALLLGKRRNASCVAREDAWIYELDRGQHDGLRGEAGRVWREVLIAALGFQIRKADAMIARLRVHAEQRSEADFEVLEQAAGTLVAYTVEDDDESVSDEVSDNEDFLSG